MPEIKYQHAIIEGCGNQIISINEVTTENRKQYKFCCIGCGHELLPRAIDSKYRKPHFYHKEIVNCSGETYLHKLAKRTIKDMFEKNDTFFVEYMATEVCKNTECKYGNYSCHKERVPKRIDLKVYYDTCQEEACIKGFVADILLTNSRKPNVPPILIEICVSHPCDEDKRNSGLHIIEIKINKEQDIIDLREEKFWREDEYVRKRDRIVEFISFNNEIRCQKHIKLKRYIYNPQQYGTNAISISNDKMVNIADALIAFWDGKSVGIKNLIEKAKAKGLKVAVVKY